MKHKLISSKKKKDSAELLQYLLPPDYCVTFDNSYLTGHENVYLPPKSNILIQIEKTVQIPPRVVFRLLEVKNALARSVGFVEKGLQRAT